MATQSTNINLSLQEQKLLRKLKDLRLRLAQTQNLPAYRIFHNKTLYRLVKVKPKTGEEMLKIKGVGEKNLRHYGEQFLEAIRSFNTPTDTPASKRIYTVSEVNKLARQMLERFSLWVEGEVSNLRINHQRYRFIYFDLKDEAAVLPCILDPETKLDFDLEEGLTLQAFGTLSLYEAGGKYQLRVQRLELAGEGKLWRQIEKIKAQLQEEGLFDSQYKKSLPLFPQRIGVVTSKAGDAWPDIKRVIKNRFPMVRLILANTSVQGPFAEAEICQAIKNLNRLGVDLIILTRGGGSLEELMAFNQETVVRAIFASKAPIISAVGHEKDYPISDLVADVRAATPSNAAELAVPDKKELQSYLIALKDKLVKSTRFYLDNKLQRLDEINYRLSRFKERYIALPRHLKILQGKLNQQIINLLANKRNEANLSWEKIKIHTQNLLARQDRHLAHLYQRIAVLSPQAVLDRGYSITYTYPRKQVLKTSEKLKGGEAVQVKLAKGGFLGKVTRPQK